MATPGDQDHHDAGATADDERETLIRRVVLRPDHPLPIYAGEPVQPIPAEWAGITHAQRVGREAFILYFLTFAGDVLGLLQYETLRIAFDLA